MGSESLAFKEWAASEGLESKSELKELAGKTIVIDAAYYLTTLLINTVTREPLLPALGGLPLMFEYNVDSDLRRLADADVKPIFVFPGLDVACRDRRSIDREAQRVAKLLDDAWKIYDEGEGDKAVVAFGKACTYRTLHVLRYLQIYVHRKGVQTVVAPYNAAAQIVDMINVAKLGAACVGSASCLVFGAAKIITGFDWTTKAFTWIDTKSILEKLSVTHDQFVDICLLSGASLLPRLPEIDNGSTSSKMSAARSVLKRANMDGHAVCLQANDETYLDLFRKARFAVKHMVIAHADGTYGPISPESAPSDTHDFISERLPDELYAYHFRGLLGTRVLNYRARQEIIETPPLVGGTSQVYQDLVQNKLMPLRTRSQALLTHSLHRYFYKKDVDLICWFNDNEKKSLGLPEMQLADVGKDAETWHVKDDLIAQSPAAKDIDIKEAPLQYAITLLSDRSFAEKTVTRRKEGENSVLTSPTELLANSIWRFLQDRGYINTDHTLSAWGQALHTAFSYAKKDGLLGFAFPGTPVNEAEEAIFIAFELLRLEILNTKELFPIVDFSGAPARGSDVDKANARLISRVACLGTFQHELIGYTGPLSRHLLAYHQMAAAVRHSLRDLAEVHSSNLMVAGSAVRIRNYDEYADWGASLPFSREPDVGLALVVKNFLDELLNESRKRGELNNWFNHALDLDADLKRAWKMWGAVNAGVQAADSAIVTSETKTMFEHADTWLHQKLALGPITREKKVTK